jgi:Protein of unknown function (DUF3306)
MSEKERIFARWSRRKREAEKENEALSTSPAQVPQSERGPDDTPDHVGGPMAPSEKHTSAEASVDLTSLPPIESIVSGTDIRAFLRSGVPAELTNAALRRTWLADPAIRNFVGIAENQWDFTNPSAVPGFANLAADEVRQLVDKAWERQMNVPGAERAAEVETTAPPQRHLSPAEPAEGIRTDAELSSENRKAIEAEATPGQCPEKVEDSLEENSAPAPKNGRRGSRRTHGTAIPE